MKKTALLAGLLSLSACAARPALACEECQLRKDGLYLGQFTLLGNGTVRSWVKYDKGKPSAVGITFSEKSLEGLTLDVPPEMPVVEYKLALPPEAKVTGIDHVSLDWNPKGHIPKGLYDVPHFDVHFYLDNLAARSKILPQLASTLGRAPEARFMPAGYIIPPDAYVPVMGTHAVDTTAPELNGKPFSTTFLYGFNNGRMNFTEPMVAISFLHKKENFSAPVKQPAAYPKRGYFPTRYSVTYNAQRAEYSIALEGLVLRAGAGVAPPKMVKAAQPKSVQPKSVQPKSVKKAKPILEASR